MFDPRRLVYELIAGAPPQQQAAPYYEGMPPPEGLMGANPMLMANATDDFRRLLKESSKIKPAPPRKEISPVDALEELRRLIRENG